MFLEHGKNRKTIYTQSVLIFLSLGFHSFNYVVYTTPWQVLTLSKRHLLWPLWQRFHFHSFDWETLAEGNFFWNICCKTIEWYNWILLIKRCIECLLRVDWYRFMIFFISSSKYRLEIRVFNSRTIWLNSIFKRSIARVIDWIARIAYDGRS